MLQSLLDLFFPRRSLAGTEGEWVTAAEMAAMRSSPVHVFLPGVMSLDHVVAAADYKTSPLVRRAVHACKYRRMPWIAPVLAELLVDASLLLPSLSAAVLCPVPLHWSREFWRGFNQAELLARLAGMRIGVPVQRLLRRRRWTRPQVGLHREARRRNTRSAFHLAVPQVPRHLILVDDVCTTGSTLDACARALREGGAERIDALVVAKD